MSDIAPLDPKTNTTRKPSRFNQNPSSENNYDSDNFEGYAKQKHTSTSRSRSNIVDKNFNEVLSNIIDQMVKFDIYRLFHAAVRKKDVPDYYDIITNPIDLSLMKSKTKRAEYKKVQ